MTDDQPWSMHSSSFSRADDPTHSMELEHDFSGGVRGKYLQQWNARLALAAEVLAIMQEAEREYNNSGNSSALACQKAQAHAIASWIQDREDDTHER